MLASQMHMVEHRCYVYVVFHQPLSAVPIACSCGHVTDRFRRDGKIPLPNHQYSGVVWAEVRRHVKFHTRTVSVVYHEPWVVPVMLQCSSMFILQSNERRQGLHKVCSCMKKQGFTYFHDMLEIHFVKFEIVIHAVYVRAYVLQCIIIPLTCIMAYLKPVSPPTRIPMLLFRHCP